MAEPMVAQKRPFEVEVKAGQRYFWCACGRSAGQPYCDGSHKGTGLGPHMFTPDADGVVYLCGCKATGTRPFCDGSHERI
jgi:CDGSH-type Zn-finger protein